MAYTEQTNVAAAQDVIDRIVSFAASAGWTVLKNAIAGTSRSATIRKDGVSDYVHLYNTDVANVYMRLSVGFEMDPALPDVLVDPSEECLTTLGVGPYPKMFLFASGNMVWVTLAIAANGEYRHLTFGVLDKIGSYEGGTYCDGTTWGQEDWWAAPSSGGNRVPLSSTHAGSRARGSLRVAVPADRPGNTFFRFADSESGEDPTVAATSVGFDQETRESAMVSLADRNAFSGRSILHAVPVFVSRAGSSTYYSPVGVVTDVRFCSINKFAPEQEITIASDTYKVFPGVGKRPINYDYGVQPAASGDYAFAIRKVP